MSYKSLFKCDKVLNADLFYFLFLSSPSYIADSPLFRETLLKIQSKKFKALLTVSLNIANSGKLCLPIIP